MTIIKKFETTEQKKVFSKKYILLATISFLMLMLIEIWASNNVVAYGEQLEQLSMIAKKLSMDNQLIENEIAKEQSMDNIASKSAELGFSQAESIQYIR